MSSLIKEKKLIITDPGALNKWIFRKVKELSDAEPEPLSQYVLALVKKDMNIKELQMTCNSLLDVFLKPNTELFVHELFHTISSNSYLSSPSTTHSTTREIENEAIVNDSSPVHLSDNKIKSLSKSKTFHREPITTTTSSEALAADVSPTHRPSTIAIPSTIVQQQSSCSSSSNNNNLIHNKYQSHRETSSSSHNRKHRPRSRSPVGKQRRTNHLHRRRRSQSSSSSRSRSPSPIQLASSVRVVENRTSKAPTSLLAQPPPPSSLTPLSSSIRRINNHSRPRCRDYDEKGVCLKGDQCEFDHGSDPVVMTSDNLSRNNAVYNPFLPELVPQWRDRINSTNFLPETMTNSSTDWNPPAYQPSPVHKIEKSRNSLLPSSNVIPLVSHGEVNNKIRGINHRLSGGGGIRDEPMSLMPTYEPTGILDKAEYVPTGAVEEVLKKILITNQSPLISTSQIAGLVDFSSTPTGFSTQYLRTRRALNLMRDSQGIRHQPYPTMSRRGAFGNVVCGFQQRGGTLSGPPGRFRGEGRGGGEAREQNCVVVYNIPQGKANVGDLNNCFKEFGNIIKIELCFNNKPDSALVYFSHEFEAERAYRHTGSFFDSPDVVVKSFRIMNNSMGGGGNRQSRGGGSYRGNSSNVSQRSNFPFKSNQNYPDSGDEEQGGFQNDDKEENTEEESWSPKKRNSENFSQVKQSGQRVRTFSETSKGNRVAAAAEEEEHRRREQEKEVALKERQEQLALLEKAKEEQRKNLIVCLTTMTELLFTKFDSESNSLKKQKLQECIFEVNNHLEHLEGEKSTDYKVEDLFKRIPDVIKRIKLTQNLNMPPLVNVSLAKENHAITSASATATAIVNTIAEKKAIRKLDSRSRDVFVTGLSHDNKTEEVENFLSLLSRSNLTVEDHKLCDYDDDQVILVTRFASRQEAENAVRGIKTFRSKPINLTFTPPIGMSSNVFAINNSTEELNLSQTQTFTPTPQSSNQFNFTSSSTGNSLQMVVHLGDGPDDLDESDEDETERSWRR